MHGMSDRSVHADRRPLAIFAMTRLLLLSYSYSSLGLIRLLLHAQGLYSIMASRYTTHGMSAVRHLAIMRYNVLNNRRKLAVDCHAALRVWSALYCCTMPTELFNNRYELRTDMHSACQRKLNW
jgi:hypothetical protein